MASRLRWVLLVVGTVGACSPEYEVLTSLGCEIDAQCGEFSFCDGDVCAGCVVLYERCAQDCPDGYRLGSDWRGDCPVCYCDAGSGGSGGRTVPGVGGYAGSKGGVGGMSLGGSVAVGGVAVGGVETGGDGFALPGGRAGGLLTGGYGTAGVAAGGFAVEGTGGCSVHDQCPAGMRCDESNECTECPPLCDACELPKEATIVYLDGCEICECLAPNECVAHEQCEPGVCRAGPLCEDGCGDPSCCYGNVCAAL